MKKRTGKWRVKQSVVKRQMTKERKIVAGSQKGGKDNLSQRSQGARRKREKSDCSCGAIRRLLIADAVCERQRTD